MTQQLISVVDENVLVVANKRATHAGSECILAAVDFLEACQSAGSLGIDAAREILRMYAKHCSWAGEPGVGDQFFVWAQQNAAGLAQARLDKDPDGNYIDFPTDESLAGFDIDDRIYVALALALDAEVVNAVDSDYARHGTALDEVGVRVRELCPGELRGK